MLDLSSCLPDSSPSPFSPSSSFPSFPSSSDSDSVSSPDSSSDSSSVSSPSSPSPPSSSARACSELLELFWWGRADLNRGPTGFSVTAPELRHSSVLVSKPVSTFWSPSSYFSRSTNRSPVCLDYDPFVFYGLVFGNVHKKERGGLFAFLVKS